MKILIVDDDPVARSVLANCIGSEEGHQASVAVDGREAWTLLDDAARSFDVVFLDVSMPNLDGFELLKRIRQSPLLKSTEVVMCTAANDRATVVKAVTLGARHYMVKPCTPEAVRAKLRQVQPA